MEEPSLLLSLLPFLVTIKDALEDPGRMLLGI